MRRTLNQHIGKEIVSQMVIRRKRDKKASAKRKDNVKIDATLLTGFDWNKYLEEIKSLSEIIKADQRESPSS